MRAGEVSGAKGSMEVLLRGVSGGGVFEENLMDWMDWMGFMKSMGWRVTVRSGVTWERIYCSSEEGVYGSGSDDGDFKMVDVDKNEGQNGAEGGNPLVNGNSVQVIIHILFNEQVIQAIPASLFVDVAEGRYVIELGAWANERYVRRVFITMRGTLVWLTWIWILGRTR